MCSDRSSSARPSRVLGGLLAFWVGIAASLALTTPARAQTGTVTIVYDFDVGGGANGISPNPVILGQDGNFYGTTQTGTGGSGVGEVFKITPGGELTILHRFRGGTDGSYPGQALVQDEAGNLYGSTSGDFSGSRSQVPTIFKLTPDGTLTTLHTFDYSTTFGGASAPLLRENDGTLYGVTYGNGNDAAGVIFKLAPDGTFTTLHDFGGAGSIAVYSLSTPVRGSDGALYGTTYNGGASNLGTVYRLAPDGTFTTLYNFGTFSAGHQVDPAQPIGNLQLGRDGSFYGVGGASRSRAYDGTVYVGGGILYRLSPDGTVSNLSDAATAYVSVPTNLVRGYDGSIYGFTNDTLLQIAPDGFVSLLYTRVGTGFIGPVAQAPDGSFYGIVPNPVDSEHVFGTVFHLVTNLRPPGVFSSTLVLSDGATAVSEGAEAVVAVHRQLGRGGAVSVQYATADATEVYGQNSSAHAGVDYVAASGTITWADGDFADKLIRVSTIDQGLYLPFFGNRAFNVTLSAPTGGAALGLFPQATALISLNSLQLTSPTAASGEVNKPFRYQVSTNAFNAGLSYDAANLPPGLGIDGFGLISGVPTAAGTYAVALKIGTATKGLTITVTAGPPPRFTSAAVASATVGSLFSYHLTTDVTAILAVTGDLPPGLSFDPATGLLAGTPTQTGAFTVNFTAATVSGGVASLTLALEIKVLPSVTVALTTSNAQFGGGTYGQFTLTLSSAQANDLRVAYSVKGTGLNGTDYALLKGTAKLKAGKTSKAVKVVPQGDGRGVTKRTVKFTLLPGDGYTVGTDAPLKVKLLAPAP